jgi:hypothetical protein
MMIASRSFITKAEKTAFLYSEERTIAWEQSRLPDYNP